MFTPCPKRSIEVIEELFNNFEKHMTFDGPVCKIHSRTLMGQNLSIKAMLKVLRAGYRVDLLLQDGSIIMNSDISSARVKITYNTSVTPPSNGIIAWCPHSPTEGNILCAQSSDL